MLLHRHTPQGYIINSPGCNPGNIVIDFFQPRMGLINRAKENRQIRRPQPYSRSVRRNSYCTEKQMLAPKKKIQPEIYYKRYNQSVFPGGTFLQIITLFFRALHLLPFTSNLLPCPPYLCKNSIMDLVLPLASAYAERFTSPEDGLLHQINQQTQAHPKAHMLSGHIQGAFLTLISQLCKPRRILEIGTFTGYSALCLAKGLADGGVLHTIELRPEDAAVARQNFNLSDANDKIILHTGNALEIIPSLQEDWDLVFIDADKTGYIGYYELLVPGLKKGGLILADNVFFHGEVLETELKGKNAKAIHAFNGHVQQDKRVNHVMLTLRDGLMLIIKK